MKNFGFFFFFLSFLISCKNNDVASDPSDGNANSVPMTGFSVASVLPHDTSYFTEGLEFYKGHLLESTGNYEKSKLVKMEFPSMKVVQEVALDPKLFGEGLTVLGDTAYQLTWQEKVVLLYDARNLKKIGERTLNREGWGLTNNGKELIASDGSSNLYFHEPNSFKLLRVQAVTENDAPVVNINELEYVEGFIYANQWQYNYILKIDPSNGKVVSKMDLSSIVNPLKSRDPHTDFLNGIAYNRDTKKLYITGKYFPELYEIQLSR